MSWAVENAVRARAIFPNSSLHQMVSILAGAHPWAVDYVTQAPVIVLAAFDGNPEAGNRNSCGALFVASDMHRLCEARASLRTVMAHFGMPYPLRKLLPYVVNRSNWGAIQIAAKCPPSALAQAIPQRPGAQGAWLRAIDHWSRRTYRVGGVPCPDGHAKWMVCRMSGWDKDTETAASLADFMAQAPNRFNLNWTLSEAKSAMERWHLELANMKYAKDFARHYGVELEERVDYPGFPDRIEIDGIEFVALRSGIELFAEGAAMHHCVFSYSGHVIGDRKRIFSVRRGGRRVGTLEMATNSEWAPYSPAQLLGPCNSTRLPADVKAAVRKFADQHQVDPLAPSAKHAG